MEQVAPLQNAKYALDSHSIYENLEHISVKDRDSAYTDRLVRQYYKRHSPLVWVDRLGVDDRADTLLAVLRREVPLMGFSEHAFFLTEIAADLGRMKSLEFDNDNPLNLVCARLEFNLTKAYLRYARGQRFGFVDPHVVLNSLYPTATDSTGRALGYHRLFDVEMDRPDKHYMEQALDKVKADSLDLYLAEILPDDALYLRLRNLLPQADATRRQTLLVNMERRRWREHDRPERHDKYVLVNVPAYHLWAVDGDSAIDMRAACGAQKTKTPLLSSYVNRMDVNPEWLIPSSIISNDIARHAGNPDYFSRHRYYIVNRNTGKRANTAEVTKAQLLSGQYRVAQEGGAGNSLGRIIFRFPNNFSVFLHDTSSRDVFSRDNRGVSHGCVRVQHPFDLAQFMLGADGDDWTLDKLRISMGIAPESDQGKEYMADTLKRKQTRLVHSLSVSPRVPLYITYYTVYPDPSGQLQYYPDVYGYDKAVSRTLEKYIR